MWPWASCWTSLGLFSHLEYQEIGQESLQHPVILPGGRSPSSPAESFRQIRGKRGAGHRRPPPSKSSVFSHCPPLPTVRSLQHQLACQTCCYDNGLQITQMQTKILTQELLGQWLLPPSPHQTEGTIWQILWDHITHLLTSLPGLLGVTRLSSGVWGPPGTWFKSFQLHFPLAPIKK